MSLPPTSIARWPDFSAYGMRLITKEGASGGLYLVFLGSRNNPAAGRALPAAGFIPNEGGFWYRRVPDRSLAITVREVIVATQKSLPEQTMGRDVPLAHVAPDLAARVPESTIKRLSDRHASAQSATLNPAPAEQKTNESPNESDVDDGASERSSDDAQSADGDRAQRTAGGSEDDSGQSPEDVRYRMRADDVEDAARSQGDSDVLDTEAPGEQLPAESDVPESDSESGAGDPLDAAPGSERDAAGHNDDGRADGPQSGQESALTNYRLGPGDLRRDAETFESAARLKENMDALDVLEQLHQDNRAPNALEKAKLAAYRGWGGLADTFRSGYQNQAHYKRKARLREQVVQNWGKEAWESMSETVLNAHYTPLDVLQFMWVALDRLGLQAGDAVLDPSGGTGHFAGTAPKDFNFTQIEIDTVTSEIARHLYPQTQVVNSGYEKAVLPDNSFEAIVSNVPFGDYGVSDDEMVRDRSMPAMRIHDYFFLKSIKKVKPGGVIAFITSKGTMDKLDTNVREALHAHGADLIAAYRLPTTAFKGTANTATTTDIVILQKRLPGVSLMPHAVPKEGWVPTRSREFSTGDSFTTNVYWDAHPDHVLGYEEEVASMHGRAKVIQADRHPDESMGAYLARRLTPLAIHLPANIMSGIERQMNYEEGEGLEVVDLPSQDEFSAPSGSYVLDDNGRVCTKEGKKATVLEGLNATKTKLLTQLIPIRDQAMLVLKAQVQQWPEDQYIKARDELNRLYDAFVKSNGPISQKNHVRLFAEDPSSPVLLALEEFDADDQTAEKADIFTRRTVADPQVIQSVESAHDAMIASLGRHGRIVPKTMMNISGRSWDELRKELKGHIFECPTSGTWETRSKYLSGNVVLKLRRAQRAAKTMARFEENVEALTAVQPTPVKLEHVGVSLGAHWVPHDIHENFMRDALAISKDRFERDVNRTGLFYNSAMNEWVALGASLSTVIGSSVNAKFGTRRLTAGKLFMDAMNMRSPKVYDDIGDGQKALNTEETMHARRKIKEIQRRFEQWLTEDPDRAQRVERAFNENVRCFVERDYDGSYLRLEGLAAGQELRPKQIRAIARVIEDGSTLIAHDVGAGKSAIMAGSCMELRRMGLAKKPAIVVPKNLLFQMPSEIKKFFPAAKVLIITKNDLKKENRKRFLYKVVNNDWDAVVMTKDVFARIPMSEAAVKNYLFEEKEDLKKVLRAMDSTEGETQSHKQIVKKVKSRMAKIEQRISALERHQDKDALSFEQMGIDYLFVDEGHYFKNLAVKTNMTDVAGINNSVTSQRAEDLNMKAKWLRDRNGSGRGISIATATPICNSMTEMYTMMQLTAPHVMEAMGIETFDHWARCFGETITALEQDSSGQTFKFVTRFARFKNMPEMVQLFRAVTDIQTAKDLKLPTPEMKEVVVSCKVDHAQKVMKKALAVRAANLSGKTEKGKDNILVVATDFRLGMLDMRLMGREFGRNPNGRVCEAAKNILSEYHDSQKIKGTQLVFSDFSSPRGHSQKEAPDDTFSVQEALRDELVAGGIPREQIAFVQDCKNDDERDLLFQRVRKGQVRVLMGSTSTLGTGTNVQTRIVAMHHLDAPHRPSDMEQRDGRGRRMGNMNSHIRSYIYTTEGYVREYQGLKIKAAFIDQAMRSPDAVARCMEEESDSASKYAEVMAQTTDNPVIKEKAEVEQQLSEIEMEQRSYSSQMHMLNGIISSKTSFMKLEIEDQENAIKTLEAIDEQDQEDRTIYIGDEGYTKSTKAAIALHEKLVDLDFYNNGGYQVHSLGRYRGIEFGIKNAFTPDSIGRLVVNFADGQTKERMLSQSIEGAIATLRNVVGDFYEKVEERVESIEARKIDIEKLNVELAELNAKGLPRETERLTLRAKADAIEQELLEITNELTQDAARMDPMLVAFAAMKNRRGKWLLDPNLLGMQPKTNAGDAKALTEALHEWRELHEDEEAMARLSLKTREEIQKVHQKQEQMGLGI